MGLSLVESKNLGDAVHHTQSEQELDLLKILSHDLRGSLVSMSAVLHLLNRDCRSKEDDFVETKLSELIDKMGNLSSMLEESLQMILAFEGQEEGREHSLIDFKRDVIDPVFAEFASEIRERQLVIESLLGTVTSFFIPARTNKTILKMVFRNIFSNAVKYTERGGSISVTIKHGSPYCLLKVFNTGRPIAEGLRSKLFSKPLPPKDRIERHLNGMGLGLHLAKRIMQTQGGEIWYEPDEEGTQFVMAIPVETRCNRYTSYVQGTLFS
jgi:signal transduction histidine kinase